MDIAKRLEELRCMDLFDFDGQIHLSLRSSSIIVAAEIIAEAIKEAASPKEETATIHNFTLNLPKGNREIYEEIQQLLSEREAK